MKTYKVVLVCEVVNYAAVYSDEDLNNYKDKIPYITYPK